MNPPHEHEYDANGGCYQCISERLDRAESEVARLRLLLIDAEHLAREGVSYTPDHFVKKWRMDERLTELRVAMRSTSARPGGDDG